MNLTRTWYKKAPLWVMYLLIEKCMKRQLHEKQLGSNYYSSNRSHIHPHKLLNNLPRTADLVADEDSTCLVLHRDTFEQLQHEEPDVAIDIILALHRDLARKVDRANQQLSLLEQR